MNTIEQQNREKDYPVSVVPIRKRKFRLSLSHHHHRVRSSYDSPFVFGLDAPSASRRRRIFNVSSHVGLVYSTDAEKDIVSLYSPVLSL